MRCRVQDFPDNAATGVEPGGQGAFRMAPPDGPGPSWAEKAKKHGWMVVRLFLIGIMAILVSGCSHFSDGQRAASSFREANDLFTQGSYQESLDKYRQIFEVYPATGDRVLFEMGFILSYPKNGQKDYGKSLECFRKLLQEYPGSEYRRNSETMILYLSNVPLKETTIAAQQTEIESLRQKVKGKEDQIVALQQKVDALEKKAITYALRRPAVDLVLIEKEARRLSLISRGELLKSYRIALGGNPVGPKEQQGDNKTPEGTYVIDARNRDSHYHRSLHISYPNEMDKKRARELGVSPGGNIMIHGIKNGFGWVGDAHAEVDWTKGCIAVTDEEIEEIDTLVPNGTSVEIRP